MLPSRPGSTTRSTQSLVHNSDNPNSCPHGGEGDPLLRCFRLRARLGPCPCRGGNPPPSTPPPSAVALSQEPRLNPCHSLRMSERLNKVWRLLHPGQAAQPLANHPAQARERNSRPSTARSSDATPTSTQLLACFLVGFPEPLRLGACHRPTSAPPSSAAREKE
ncbi:hypothetical protein NDU88_000929 [Pleurodeles waltl]|uniref:Uncharacterized protein n=1 Tax=Pleurodeles waltl TaxID=8319 RepID=A0AAV7S8C8_PLEWA|nr:hypothetical protein NDU88_000929 [Pleurodeles waltl]